MVDLETMRLPIVLDDQVSKGMDKVADSVGGTAKSVDQLDKELKNVSAALKSAANAIDNMGTGGGKAEKELSGLESILGKIGITGVASFTPIGAAITAVTVAATAVVAGITAAAVGIAYVTTKTADLGDELFTLSQKTGIQVEALSEFRYVAAQTGVELNTITSGVQLLQKGIGEGGEKVEKALGRLGLSLSELKNQKPEEAFKSVISALSEIPSNAERAALGAAVFRGKFKELAALTREDVGGIIKDFDDLGAKVDEETARMGDAFNDAKTRLAFIFEGIQTNLGKMFLPAAAAVFTAFGDAWTATRKQVGVDSDKFQEYIDKTAEVFIMSVGYMIKAVAEVSTHLADFFLGKDIGSFKLIERLAEVADILLRLQLIQARISGDKWAADLINDIRSLNADVKAFSASAKNGFEDVRQGIHTAADAAKIFGDNLIKNAPGAVQRIRDGIHEASEATEELTGNFESLNSQSEKIRESWKKLMDSLDAQAFKAGLAASKKFWDDQIKDADRLSKTVGDMFKGMVKDQEDADRQMRRLTMSRTQFEVFEIRKRLAEQIEAFKNSGVGAELLQARIKAAMNKAEADIAAVTHGTEEMQSAWEQVTALVPGIGSTFAIAMRAVKIGVEGANDAIQEQKEHLQEVKQAWADIGGAITNVIADAIRSGEGFEAIAKGLGKIFSDSVQQSINTGIQKGIKDGTLSTAGAIAMGAGGAAFGAIAGAWVDALVYYINKEENERKLMQAADALASQFAAQFGGSRELRQLFRQVGIDAADPRFNVFGGGSSPEAFQEHVNRVLPLIDAWKAKMEGLSQAAQGVNRIMEGVGASFEKSMKDQLDAQKKVNDSIIKGMKDAGASTDDVTKKQEELANALDTKVFTATQKQIDAFNRVGVIAGGVIANTVNQTGDLVGAVLSVADTLNGLGDIRDKFNLGDQANAATQQVLGLYDAIIKNEDVFTSISGVGQAMDGLGNAVVVNNELIAAFGGQLAADFAELEARGVDVSVIWASMAPQLQQLWELQKDGRVVVDDTTKALLEQAEAAGVVGDVQRDVNERILNVLTDIKDLLGMIGNVALPRVGTAGENAGNAINRGLRNASGGASQLREDVNHVQDGLDGLKAPDLTVKVGWDIEDPPTLDYGQYQNDWGWRDGRPQPEGFRSGSDGFRDFGDGTLAVLHGRERIQTYSDYMGEERNQTIIVEVEGEAIVAANVRNQARYTRIRTGNSPRTVR